jgi:hypothetical protein
MKKNFFLLFVVAVMLVSLIGCQTEEAVSPLSAALSELSGTVELKQAGQADFSLAAVNTTLEVNGQVQTGDDGRVRLDLSSGTIIRVSPSSFFILTSNEETDGGLITKIKLEVGKIFIILNGGQADVETPSGAASVRGSYMKVEVDPITKDIYITCLEGNCSASNPAGTVNFTNGQSVILFAFDEATGTWTAPGVLPMTPEEFQEWLDNNPEAQELFNQAMGTATALAQTEEPTQTPTATPTLVQALPATEASNACFQITQPASGQVLPKQGQVNFEWTSQTGAEKYVITFIDENGNKATIGTFDTNLNQYIEVLPNGGSYEWFVTAYGADGNSICSTSANSFSKPKGDPTPKPTEEEEEAPACDPCDPNPESGCYDESYYYDNCVQPG